MNPLIHMGGELTLNDDDISKALTKISFMAAIMVTAKVKRRANMARLNVERKKSNWKIFSSTYHLKRSNPKVASSCSRDTKKLLNPVGP